MRWPVLFILFSLLSSSLKSQPGEDFVNDIKANHQSYKKLKKIFYRYMIADSNLTIMDVAIDFPYFVTSEISFEINQWKDKSFPSYLKLFYKKDKIVYLKIFNGMGKDNEDIIFQYLDSSFSDDMLRKHNVKYGTDFLLDDMYARKRWMPMYDLQWYSDPFIGPSDNLEMRRLFECVLNKDSMAIIRYAANFSPEMTGYGATGLYIWERENSHLDKKTKSLLRSLQRSTCPIVFTQGGCLAGTEKLSSVISDSYLQELYEEYLLFKKERTKDVPCQAPAGSTFL